MKPATVIYMVVNFQDLSGPYFICTDKGTARPFPTATHAWDYIEGHLDPRVWSVAVMTELQI